MIRRSLWPRTLAAAALGAMVAVQCPAVDATADTLRPLDVTKCHTYRPTPTGVVPTAWQMDRLNLGEAWNLATGKGISIAVIDTGTSNINTPYLSDKNVMSLDFLPSDPEKAAKEGFDCHHGTMVTSLIVGARGKDPRTAFAGVAPDAKVYAMRVLVGGEGAAKNEETAAQEMQALIKAIDEAVRLKVQVINISQAMSGGTPQYQAAIKRAIDAGIVVVAAAGNKDMNLSGPAYPAAYPGVIAVGMSLPQDTASEAGYSNADTGVAVAAPGEQLTALAPSQPLPKQAQGKPEAAALNQAYDTPTGTSFAAPIVSGVVALMLEREPKLTPAQVKQRLIETADPPPVAPPDPRLGYGVVNPLRALAGPGSATRSNPKATVAGKVETVPPKPPVDQRPKWIALGLAAVAGVVSLAGLILRITIPPAARRKFRAAER